MKPGQGVFRPGIGAGVVGVVAGGGDGVVVVVAVVVVVGVGAAVGAGVRAGVVVVVVHCCCGVVGGSVVVSTANPKIDLSEHQWYQHILIVPPEFTHSFTDPAKQPGASAGTFVRHWQVQSSGEVPCPQTSVFVISPAINLMP